MAKKSQIIVAGNHKKMQYYRNCSHFLGGDDVTLHYVMGLEPNWKKIPQNSGFFSKGLRFGILLTVDY